MSDITNKKQEPKKANKFDIKIASLDTDKAEYQQIVLSNSNFPDKNYWRP